MVTFDNLVHEIDARYCLGPKAAPLIQETSRLVSKQPGGVGGVVRRFRDAGFAVEAASWLEGSDPVPLSGQEVEQTLGSEVVSGIANKIGESQHFTRTILGYAIPGIIVLLAQGGAVPSALRASVSRIFGLAIPRSPSRPQEITKHTPQQIRPSITEGSGATPVLGGSIILCTTLLVTLALVLGYYVGASDREVIQSSPISAQIAPVVPLHVTSMLKPLPFSNENYAFVPIAGRGTTEIATASWAFWGDRDKNQTGAPSQTALKFPTIYFIANSAEILSTSNPLLLKAARLIKQLPAGTLVEVAGYTHNIGSPTINMQLSQRRANAVLRALVRAGVDPAMLTAKGYASSRDLTLASQNGTVEGRSSGVVGDRRRNDRRVEFSITHQ
jgi:outer membrane protein OmpA-like peptidoglycan-associated protein/uncharacterized protein YidB (DUF937 family)